jgi:arylsulfatase A-like enzyme/Tfp pilus assembly protein PilF
MQFSILPHSSRRFGTGRATRTRSRRITDALLVAGLVVLIGGCQSESRTRAEEKTAEGDRLLAEERAGEALAAYRTALIHAPDYLPARIGAGRVEAMARNFEAADREFQIVLAKDPRSSAAQAGYAEALWLAGRYAESEQRYRRALELAPDAPEIASAHAMALVSLRRDAEGLEQFRRAQALGAELSGSAHLFWGAALERAGNPDEALEHYEAALALEPMDPTIQNNLGLLLAKQGIDRERGARLLEYAVAQRRQDANTVFNLGWTYFQMGRYEDAADFLRRAIGLTTPGSPAFQSRVEQFLLADAKIERQQAPASAPDILLVVVDSLRADHVGAYGYERPVTPHFDAVASGGVVFEQAISQAPWTAASFATLLTGLVPTVHGLDGDEPPPGGETPKPGAAGVQKSLAATNHTLAERLRAAGYRTAAFAANASVHSAFGFAQGFDSFADSPLPAASGGFAERRAEEVNQLAFEWLASAPEDPLFLLVHYTDPHWPYDPPAPHGEDFVADYRGKLTPDQTTRAVVRLGQPVSGLDDEDRRYLVGLYDGEIQYADAQLGALLDRIREQRGTRPLLTVLTADHGTEFFDHGSASHGYSLYDEQLRVPLIVSLPGRLAPRRVAEQVALIDVLPTLLELAGVPGGAVPVQGESLVARARGAHAPARESILSEVPLSGNWKALRSADGGKLIRNVDDGREQLFDLREDPGERRDMAAAPESAERLAALDRELARWIEESSTLQAALREEQRGDASGPELGQTRSGAALVKTQGGLP